MDKKNKKHIFFIILIIILTLILFHRYVSPELQTFSNRMTIFTHYYSVITESVLKYHQFPHWHSYVEGGEPLFADPQQPTFIFQNTILFLLINDISLVSNITLLLAVILAGASMYVLMIHFKFEPKIAFISALIYMFNSNFVWNVVPWQHRPNAIIYLPLIFLFFTKALESKEWVKYSIITALLFSLQFFSDAIDYFLISSIIFICFAVFYVLFNFSSKKIIKTGLVGLIILLIFLAITSIRTLPLLEFGEVSSKSRDFSYKESIGNKLELDGLLKLPLYGKPEPGKSPGRIGIAAFILVLFALPLIKKKRVLFFFILVLIGLLEVTGSPLHYIWWKLIPGFAKIHHVVRAFFIYTFACSFLAGAGAYWLLNYTKRKFDLNNKKLNILYIAICLLIVIELGIVAPHSFGFNIIRGTGLSYNEHLNNMDILQYIANQPGIFRTHSLSANMLGGSSAFTYTPLHIQGIHPSGSIWIPEFFNEYRGIAHSQPAKFYGMLNVKYITSDNLVNNTNYKYIDKFKECQNCHMDGSVDPALDGPYLYENKLFLPRAHVVNKAILVIGEKNSAKQFMYSLMLNDNFNPSNTVIVMFEGLINNYDFNLLRKFDAIILTQGSVDGDSGFILNQYINQGGNLLPNILKGENSISNDQINSALWSLNKNYNADEIDIPFYSPNKIELELNGEKGFLVLSEKFFMFEGWKAKINNQKKDILRANGINSAVYLDGEKGRLTFYYSPKSFNKGLTIALITLLLILIYFIWKWRKK